MRRKEVLFVGTLSWHPNEQGLTWYIKNVLPKSDPEIEHQIVGGGASESLRAILEMPARLIAHGYVDDLETFYQSARCLVAPLLSGSGIKIKIVNALARGLPVVTTPIGIEGFPPNFGAAVTVAESPEAFARAIATLCQNSHAWSLANERALKYFKTHFLGRDWQQWAKELRP